jgi:hypothetical protein
MDKNIAAFLDNSAYTVHVAFQQESGIDARVVNQYTYVCNIPGIKADDYVVVADTVGSGTCSLRAKPASRVVDIDELIEDEITDVASLRGQLKVARVIHVDSTVDIEPNSSKQYKWVISKLDLTAHAELLTRNKKIEMATTKAYRKSMQRTFADRILGDMDPTDKDNLLKLLGK